MKIEVVIPFRLRKDADLRRAANLEVVQAWWYAHGFNPKIVSDGLGGDEQFNRHRAYNRAVSRNPADVYVFTEADMLVHPNQVRQAVRQASACPGLVVPFTQYRYLSDSVTRFMRDTVQSLSDEALAEWWALPPEDPNSIFDVRAESTMEGGKSIGAVNVVSRQTLLMTGGFTEATRGNWFDDNIIEEGFAYLTGSRTRWIKGPAVHLYHLPGHRGDHLTPEDRQATASNKALLDQMRKDIKHGGRRWEVRSLMGHRAQ